MLNATMTSVAPASAAAAALGGVQVVPPGGSLSRRAIRRRWRIAITAVRAAVRLFAVTSSRLSDGEREAALELYLRFSREEGPIDSRVKMRKLLFASGQLVDDDVLDTLCERVGHALGSTLQFAKFAHMLAVQKQHYMRQQDVNDTQVAFNCLMDPVTGDIDTRRLLRLCREFNLSEEVDALIRDTDADGSGRIDLGEFTDLLEDRVGGSSGGDGDDAGEHADHHDDDDDAGSAVFDSFAADVLGQTMRRAMRNEAVSRSSAGVVPPSELPLLIFGARRGSDSEQVAATQHRRAYKTTRRSMEHALYVVLKRRLHQLAVAHQHNANALGGLDGGSRFALMSPSRAASLRVLPTPRGVTSPTAPAAGGSGLSFPAVASGGGAGGTAPHTAGPDRRRTSRDGLRLDTFAAAAGGNNNDDPSDETIDRGADTNHGQVDLVGLRREVVRLRQQARLQRFGDVSRFDRTPYVPQPPPMWDAPAMASRPELRDLGVRAGERLSPRRPATAQKHETSSAAAFGGSAARFAGDRVVTPLDPPTLRTPVKRRDHPADTATIYRRVRSAAGTPSNHTPQQHQHHAHLATSTYASADSTTPRQAALSHATARPADGAGERSPTHPSADRPPPDYAVFNPFLGMPPPAPAASGATSPRGSKNERPPSSRGSARRHYSRNASAGSGSSRRGPAGGDADVPSPTSPAAPSPTSAARPPRPRGSGGRPGSSGRSAATRNDASSGSGAVPPPADVPPELARTSPQHSASNYQLVLQHIAARSSRPGSATTSVSVHSLPPSPRAAVVC